MMKNLSPIIPVNTPECQAYSWKSYLKNAIKEPHALLQQLGLNNHPIAKTISEQTGFKMRVPQPFIDKMQPSDPNDPLLLQVLSTQQELISPSDYNTDPLQESALKTTGILHKYPKRALMILSSACAINCRYCFRRHFPYQDKAATGESLQKALDYIKENKSLSEIILSGGDPLIIDDKALEKLITQIANISHIKRLRIHTRLPVVIPQRLTQSLLQILTQTPLETSMVLHINHSNEIDLALKQALTPFKNSSITLLNQAVLLKNINDSTEQLCQLSEDLFSAGILPYYLHLLDKVQGAAHFDLDEKLATHLVNQLRNTLPGYLVPRLCREIPNKSAKTIIV